jgi:methyl coenzyme M reductase gamma subunit
MEEYQFKLKFMVAMSRFTEVDMGINMERKMIQTRKRSMEVASRLILMESR